MRSLFPSRRPPVACIASPPPPPVPSVVTVLLTVACHCTIGGGTCPNRAPDRTFPYCGQCCKDLHGHAGAGAA